MLIGVSWLFMTTNTVWAQKEKFHSIFIYNFSKYVKWPDDHGSGKFIIGVYGSSAIEKDLIEMADSKRVNGMPIEIRRFKSVEGIQNCHILYVASSESAKLDQIVSTAGADPVLIVTDKPGLARQGAAINFVELDGKIKFELNQYNAESKGLKVAGALSSLAILI